MISKLSWILFVPFTAAAVFLKLAETILPDGAVYGLSDLQLDYVVVGCVAVIFLFALIMCLADRKISPYYQPHRNIAAGIFGILLAVVCAADGADRIYNIIGSGSIDVMEMIETVLLMLTAVVFVVLGLTHFTAKATAKGFVLFNIIPALLCAVRLVRCFIGFTTISIVLADILTLICYIFATMFFFNYAVALSLTEAKHATKSCFIFGFPAVAALLAYGVNLAYTSLNLVDIMANIAMAEILLIALYIFSFIFEMTIFVKDKEHVVIEGIDNEEYEELKDESQEDIVVTGLDDDERLDEPSSYLSTADTSDFLYQETPNENDKKENNDYHGGDLDDFITEVVATEDDDHDGSVYGDRLDEIDKLILEISGDN